MRSSTARILSNPPWSKVNKKANKRPVPSTFVDNRENGSAPVCARLPLAPFVRLWAAALFATERGVGGEREGRRQTSSSSSFDARARTTPHYSNGLRSTGGFFLPTHHPPRGTCCPFLCEYCCVICCAKR